MIVFAYTSHSDATLAEVMREGICLKKTKTDADRGVANDYPIRLQSDVSESEKLLVAEKAQFGS